MAHKISGLQPLILWAHPCAAGNAEYFSVSFSAPPWISWRRARRIPMASKASSTTPEKALIAFQGCIGEN